MRKISILAAGFAALALSACSETSPDITAADLAPSYVKTSTGLMNPNGPTWILGTFELQASFDIVGTAPGVNSHPQGLGTCRNESGDIAPLAGGAEYSIWYNKQGHETSAKHCQGEEGTSVSDVLTCTIDPDGLPATYAFSTGGQGAPNDNGETQTKVNENLNFHSNLLPPEATQFVHYQGNKRLTTNAKDSTVFVFTCGEGASAIQGEGTIDLTLLAGPSNIFKYLGVDRRQIQSDGAAVDASNAGGSLGVGELTGDLHWLYRSRIATI